jgi:streptogramin lyase
MAFDSSGSLWVANTSQNGIGRFSVAGGTVGSGLYSGGGVSNPRALAVDGLGQVWIANGNGTLSAFANTGNAISPSSGIIAAGLSTPGGVAIDLSGNVWVSNTTNNSVTEIVGAAVPVAPLSTSLTNSTTGARP